MPRKWWQRKWYFVLPVAVVFAIGVYLAAVDEWRSAAIYFVATLFYAVLARNRWQRYGRPREGDS
jgi:hypothetical protein